MIDHNTESEATAIELDSHADSPVVGRHAHIHRHTGTTVKVSGFTDALGSALTVPIVDAMYCYDCEYSGETYLMIIRNALYLKEMTSALIPPFMMRMAGIDVDKCPKFLAKKPTINNHSVFFDSHAIRLPLKIHGIISYLPVRSPHEEEIKQVTT